MLSLDPGGRSLVLPQLNVLCFVDSPWEALPFRRSGLGGREVREGAVRGGRMVAGV